MKNAIFNRKVLKNFAQTAIGFLVMSLLIHFFYKPYNLERVELSLVGLFVFYVVSICRILWRNRNKDVKK